MSIAASHPLGADETADGPWVGRPVLRVEDERLIRGRGCYVDDIVLPGQLHVQFVRSPHPHAEIIGIDANEATSAAGVVVVRTGSNLDTLSPIKPDWIVPGTKPRGRPPIAGRRVRHFGEIVAAVVADTAAAAADAAERVRVSYRPLPFVTDGPAALMPGAPRLHDDLDDNAVLVYRAGNGGFDEAAAAAPFRTSFKLRNQRLLPFSIEARAVNVAYESASGRMTVHISQQMPHQLRSRLAAALDFPEHKLRVISPDVGGGFGPKMHFYPEDVLVAYMARELGRPVKWSELRRENAAATTHGRDHHMSVEVAADLDGRFRALRVHSTANVGAYLSSMGSGVPTLNVAPFMLGVYTIPHAEVSITCVYTNTTPVDAYRGAGRPEAAYMVERMVERVAQELGLDPAEVRMRNFIAADQLPTKQSTGAMIDSGQYAHTLQVALERADYAGFRSEQAGARASGRLLGVGISTYTETCGTGMAERLASIGFSRGGFESALVRVQADGRVLVLSGSHSHGQGHLTTFAQIAADALGLPMGDIDVQQGDTDLVPYAVGTFNSRSVVVGGSAVKTACGRVAIRMRAMAAHLLQADPARIVLADRVFRVEGSNASIAVRDVARAAWLGQGIPRDMGIGLEETEFYHPEAMSAPYGAHIAMVEIDRETGELKILRYVAIDDCGIVINPLLARGQVHGGVAQGIGQALYEDGTYDEEGLPPLEPAIPRFDMLPRFETDHTVTPTSTNPLGAKGLGEAGAIGAPPAIVNAAIDALWHLGVRDLDMPLTPERVLAAIRLATGGAQR